MTMRMAGISGMFDTESMVTQTLQPYKLKVTNKVKERDLFQLKQTQYRDVMSKCTTFYNKYFKTGTAGLLSPSNYQALTFTSNDSGKVTAKAGSTAILDNYKVSVKQVATAATATIEKSNFLNADGTVIAGKSIVVNGQSITLSGANTKEMVDNLNADLIKNGINVSAKYTDFARDASGTQNVSALVLQSKDLGKDTTFSVGTLFDKSAPITSTTHTGTNAVAAKAEFNLSDVSIPSTININGADVQLTSNNPDDIVKSISQTISDLSLGLSVKYDSATTKFTIQNTDATVGNDVVIGGVSNVVQTHQQSATKTTAELDLSSVGINGTSREILINGKSVKFATTDNDKDKMLTAINNQISSLGLEATKVYDVDGVTWSGTKIKLTSKTAGQSTIDAYKQNGASGIPATVVEGKDADVTITNSTGGVYKHTGGTNSINLDGVNFTINQSTYDDANATAAKATFTRSNLLSASPSSININDTVIAYNNTDSNADILQKINAAGLGIVAKVDGDNFTIETVNKGSAASLKFAIGSDSPVTNYGTTPDVPVTLTGKKDATALKDKIISFIKDYNELITNLNTKLNEKRYKTYMPLSTEEKKDMKDSDIALWNERVNSGLIRKDNDVERIVNSMKSAMRTMMSDNGLKLEKIGITPLKGDYKTLDGTFEVNEETLTTALENNMDGVKELFLKEPSGTTNYQDGGIITNLKATLYKEAINYNTSAIIKKAGYNGSISDDMSLQLTKMQTKIDDMNTDLTTRENALYTKYGRLEAAMSKLQAQQSKLSSQFG